jgi:hypothetical protein
MNSVVRWFTMQPAQTAARRQGALILCAGLLLAICLVWLHLWANHVRKAHEQTGLVEEMIFPSRFANEMLVIPASGRGEPSVAPLPRKRS